MVFVEKLSLVCIYRTEILKNCVRYLKLVSHQKHIKNSNNKFLKMNFIKLCQIMLEKKKEENRFVTKHYKQWR